MITMLGHEVVDVGEMNAEGADAAIVLPVLFEAERRPGAGGISHRTAIKRRRRLPPARDEERRQDRLLPLIRLLPAALDLFARGVAIPRESVRDSRVGPCAKRRHLQLEFAWKKKIVAVEVLDEL